jgi:hypothetical protein
MRQQSMPTGHVQDAAAAEQPPRAPRHFPRFEQLFARQTAGFTEGTADAIEQRGTGEASEIMTGQPGPGVRREARSHTLLYSETI